MGHQVVLYWKLIKGTGHVSLFLGFWNICSYIYNKLELVHLAQRVNTGYIAEVSTNNVSNVRISLHFISQEEADTLVL